jgi:peptidoglycan/LPS O-acetylase OafA/YrhL
MTSSSSPRDRDEITTNPVGEGRQHVSGLDSIRGLCAVWVVFSHLGFFPDLAGLFAPHTTCAWIVRGVLSNLFCGVPAVIVFFIVSGFCIHYPHVNNPTVPGVAFLARRLVRIGVPFASAWLLLRWLAPASLGLVLVQWSLIAEVVYYLLYPLLFRLRQRASWKVWIGLSLLAAVMIMTGQPKARYFQTFGPELTWAIGLPHWLMGCYLAENLHGRAAYISPGRIWTLRLMVWMTASVASVMQFHFSVGYPWTMLAFTPLAVMWIREEICWHSTHQNARLAWLAWLGAWSYSIYLLHLAGPDLLRRWGLPLGIRDGTLGWSANLIGALAVCYCFHLLVEKPSHRLARWIGKWLSGRKPASETNSPAN